MKIGKILLLAIFVSVKSWAQDDTSLAQPEEPATAPMHTYAPQGHMYHTINAVDMPITLVLGSTSLYLITSVIYNKPKTPESVIMNLNKNDVPSYDRWSAGWYDANLNTISYYPFFAVMPLPLVLLADKKIAKDKGRIGLMYLEAFAFEGIMYTTSVNFANRFRPEAYDTNLSVGARTGGGLKNSFFAGHVAVTALSTLFVSKVYNDYHPHAKIRWVLYGSSAALTLAMAYMRLYAGQHFTSDIVVGAVVGTACGLGVPMVHKNRDFKKQKWSVYPDFNIMNRGTGIGFNYRF